MLNVAENVGVCGSFDESVFFAAVWTHQPSLDDRWFVADQGSILQNSVSAKKFSDNFFNLKFGTNSHPKVTYNFPLGP
jgi:hypothetical protein